MLVTKGLLTYKKSAYVLGDKWSKQVGAYWLQNVGFSIKNTQFCKETGFALKLFKASVIYCFRELADVTQLVE